MDTLTCKKVIQNRKSVRSFSDEKIGDDEVMQILDAGRLAPSAKNRQPWKFYVLKEKEKDMVVETLLSTLNKNNTEATGIASANIMKQADKVVLVFMDDEVQYNRTTNLLSIGACVENMLLQATEMGIGSLWVYDICVISDELKKLINVSGELISAIYFGKENNILPRAKKKTLDEVVIR